MDKKQMFFIELPCSIGSELVNPEDIISIRANDKSICIDLENHQKKSIKLSMGKAEKLLPQTHFVRCHRSHIINVLKIKGRIKKYSKLLLSNGQEIPVSQTCKKQLDETLNLYCKKLNDVNV